MKKIYLFLSLLIVTSLLMIGCVNTSDLSEEESDSALAGQAVNIPIVTYFYECNDSDGVNAYQPGYVEVGYKTTKSSPMLYMGWTDGVLKSGSVVIPGYVKEYSCKSFTPGQSASPVVTKSIKCAGGSNKVDVLMPMSNKVGSSVYCICTADSQCEEGKVCVENACVDAPVAPTCTPKVATCAETGISCPDGEIVEKVACGVGMNCTNGVCVDIPVSACTAGPTGKIKCVGDSGYYYATKEYQKVDCSTYLGTSWSYCGNSADWCKEDVGCCPSKFIESTCQDEMMVNGTKNMCTNNIDYGYTNCSTTVYLSGKPFICTGKDYSGITYYGCHDSCTPGEEKVTCSYNYYKYVCNSDGLDYNYVGQVTSCPTGTTCQSGICK